jgi:hypothetical protein
MSDADKGWPELYRGALLESDPGRLQARIEEAQKAIQHRARELWYAGSPETRERHDLDAAVRFLGLLKTVGVEIMTREQPEPLRSDKSSS